MREYQGSLAVRPSRFQVVILAALCSAAAPPALAAEKADPLKCEKAAPAERIEAILFGDDASKAEAWEREARASTCSADDASRARAHAALARALHLQGRFDEAETDHRAALAIDAGLATPLIAAQRHYNHADTLRVLERWAETEAEARKAVDLGRAAGAGALRMADFEVVLAVALIELDRLSEADPLLDRALAARRQMLGPQSSKTLNVEAWQARAALKRGREEQAEQAFARLFEKRQAAGDPDATQGAASEYAAVLEARNKAKEAEAPRRAALAAAERNDPDLAPWLAIDLGINLALQGKDDAALPELTGAIDRIEKKDGSISADDLIDPADWVSRLLARRNKNADALVWLDRVIAARTSAVGSDDVGLARDYRRRAAILVNLDRAGDALRNLDTAERIANAKDPSLLSDIERQRGVAHLVLGNLGEAQKAADRALRLVDDASSIEASDILVLKGAVAAEALNGEERTQSFRSALAIRQKELGWADAQTYTVAWDLIGALIDQRDWAAAEEVARDAAFRIEQAGAAQAAVLTQSRLAHILLERQRWDEASIIFRRFVERAERDTDPALRQSAASALAGLGQIAEAQGDVPSARSFLQRALAAWRDIEPAGMLRRNIAAIERRLAAILLREKRFADARPLVDEALVIFRDTEGQSSLNAAWTVTAQAKTAAGLNEPAVADRLFREALALQEKSIAESDLIEALEAHASFALDTRDDPELAVRQIRRAAAIARCDIAGGAAAEASDRAQRRRAVFEVAVRSLWRAGE